MQAVSADSHLPPVFSDWFAARGWRLRAHQRAMIDAACAGEHALLVAATGAGKTLAGFLPSLIALAEAGGGGGSSGGGSGVHTLYISPLKALASDVRRNLLLPIEAMALPIRVEARTGDTPSDRRARQKAHPPDILLTTPESLSLLLSHEDAPLFFADLDTVVIDEVHAFGTGKRGDLLQLGLARLQAIRPALRRVALSATVADPGQWRGWLAPGGDIESVRLVEGEPGAAADIRILLPDPPAGIHAGEKAETAGIHAGEKAEKSVRVPWSGHSGKYAVHAVMTEIERHRTTIIFVNTRGLAELIFQELWKANDKGLPIGVHHGSLSLEARRKVEEAMADGRVRALVATASLDLGLDWGDVDCVIQMGAPKGSSRLIQRIGRANHRLDEPSKALVVPGNRFEWLEARAALDAVEAGERDPDLFRPGSLDVLAQHITAVACSGGFSEDALFAEVTSTLPYAALDRETFERTLGFVRDGGYALKAYDKFRRLAPDGVDAGGGRRWRIAGPRFVLQHRMNAGIIVDAPNLTVRFRNGRKLGTVEDYFASTLVPGDTFTFSGISVEVEGIKDSDLVVRATARSGRIPSYMGARMALTTNLAERVRRMIADPREWRGFPDDVAEWLGVQAEKSHLPQPHELLVETFPHEDRHYWLLYPFEGWNAHQALGMLLTKRMERAGLQPLGFQATDYALAIWSVKPVDDPAALLTATIMTDEFIDWVKQSHLLKRAFREVAVIGGLVERQHPGKKKTGRQVTFSTDLIFDVLMRYQPDHLLIEAAWADARARLTDVGRLGDLIERAAGTMVHKTLLRISPIAVPVLMLIGRESVAQQATDDALLAEAEAALVKAAMGDSNDKAR
jgi:ATP-dependent helicase Lhr and Lhr-like helicase